MKHNLIKHIVLSTTAILFVASTALTASDQKVGSTDPGKAVTTREVVSTPGAATGERQLPLAQRSPGESAAGEEANWQVLSGGGSHASAGSLVLASTIGQTAVGASINSYDLNHGFWQNFGIDPSCCVGRVGDANGVGGDEPTIGDVSVMIDAKFITGDCVGPIEPGPILPCLAEADINQTGGIDPTCDDITIGDVSILIDYLFITGPSLGLPECL